MRLNSGESENETMLGWWGVGEQDSGTSMHGLSGSLRVGNFSSVPFFYHTLFSVTRLRVYFWYVPLYVAMCRHYIIVRHQDQGIY